MTASPAANRIAALRAANGLTQSQLAARLGVHWVTVSRLERGKMKLTADWMERIAIALNARVTDIIKLPATEELVTITATIIRAFELEQLEEKTSYDQIVGTFDLEGVASLWFKVGDDTMAPFFFKGDALRFSYIAKDGLHLAFGRLCHIVGDDGRSFIGIIDRQVSKRYWHCRTCTGFTLGNVRVNRAGVLSMVKVNYSQLD
ncbi:helix-turn-helix transcriptional regulator [Rhizobium sp. NZLR10]|uniref:helix-turn-helix domain-containing protein n=1 Tax=Rhizobium sp. NZLR10 TaxID=2731097 RepID=UPI001C838475|nr:helix-turn-helix transcriptional regulator [Rhizobium sp. NZLR10]MBX5195744.1 helix-turn-helix transcriptional regulator [Rhizobium sp. NZLR10]